VNGALGSGRVFEITFDHHEVDIGLGAELISK
jgi:hypothetical protein